MAPKKKKIIKKRKITKADVKRIPKYPNVKANINLSPYDIANMVQQRFQQDMEADSNKIKRRQAEIKAEREAIQSPEFKKALDENTKSSMSLQKELATYKEEMRRAQVDAQREFERSPEFKEMLGKLVLAKKYAEHSKEMQRAESDRIQADIVRQIQSTQKDWEQRLEKAQLERETQQVEQVNGQIDKLKDEKAGFVVRAAKAKGANHAEKLPSMQKKIQQNAQGAAKAAVQAEHEEEALAITKKEQENIRRQAYLKALQEDGPKFRAAEGEAMAKADLERQRLESEIERERKKQKLLMEKENVAKELAQQKEEMIQHLQKLKQNDPSSRIIGDPSIFEADLYMLGPEQERYKELYRQQLETVSLQNVVLSQDREIRELQEQINSSEYGVKFEQLYDKDPGRMVKALGDLAQLRQGRAILWEDMASIFPSVKDVQQRQEQRAEELARRDSEIRGREEAVGAREQQMTEIDNQLREAKITIQRQNQQLAAYQQQYG